jgi:hypothetical protein
MVSELHFRSASVSFPPPLHFTSLHFTLPTLVMTAAEIAKSEKKNDKEGVEDKVPAPDGNGTLAGRHPEAGWKSRRRNIGDVLGVMGLVALLAGMVVGVYALASHDEEQQARARLRTTREVLERLMVKYADREDAMLAMTRVLESLKAAEAGPWGKPGEESAPPLPPQANWLYPRQALLSAGQYREYVLKAIWDGRLTCVLLTRDHYTESLLKKCRGRHVIARPESYWDDVVAAVKAAEGRPLIFLGHHEQGSYATHANGVKVQIQIAELQKLTARYRVTDIHLSCKSLRWAWLGIRGMPYTPELVGRVLAAGKAKNVAGLARALKVPQERLQAMEHQFMRTVRVPTRGTRLARVASILGAAWIVRDTLKTADADAEFLVGMIKEELEWVRFRKAAEEAVAEAEAYAEKFFQELQNYRMTGTQVHARVE